MEGYTLRVPFRLPDKQINLKDGPITVNNLTLKKTPYPGRYALLITGFSSHKEAEDFLPRVKTALSFLLLENETAYRANWNLKTVAIGNKPPKNFLGIEVDEAIDGIGDGDCPTVYPSSKNVKHFLMGDVNAYVSMGPEACLKKIQEGFEFPVGVEEEFEVPLDFFNSHFTENTNTAKFLSLIMAFEKLCGGGEKSGLAQKLIKKWEEEVAKALEVPEISDEDKESLNALQGMLSFGKFKSIGTQIKELVLSSLPKDADVQKVAALSKDLYGKRSKLVHSSKTKDQDIGDEVMQARDIIKRILKAKFLKKAQ